MLTYKSEWWQIELPEGWEAECDDVHHSFYQPDEVGALQITAYCKETAIDEEDLFEMIDLEDEAREHLAPATLGEFTGHQLIYSEDGIFWHKWWVYLDSLLVFVTYTCNEEDRQADVQVLSQILGTLSTTPES